MIYISGNVKLFMKLTISKGIPLLDIDPNVIEYYICRRNSLFSVSIWPVYICIFSFFKKNINCSSFQK